MDPHLISPPSPSSMTPASHSVSLGTEDGRDCGGGFRHESTNRTGSPNVVQCPEDQALFIRKSYVRAGGVWGGPTKGPLIQTSFSLSQFLGQDFFGAGWVSEPKDPPPHLINRAWSGQVVHSLGWGAGGAAMQTPAPAAPFPQRPPAAASITNSNRSEAFSQQPSQPLLTPPLLAPVIPIQPLFPQ